jgi:bifunctional non-homologous end joining protein LigD
MAIQKETQVKTKKRDAAAKAAAVKHAKPPRRAASGSKASDAIDRQLARYRSMRDFNITSEPGGGSTKGRRASPAQKSSAGEGLPFVIQKHAASHLHYDFRLGWNGVLKSWACAKGPSYYPGDRRLAVQVEDHPIEYGGFEGIIPQGQYGGGTVMLWDQGIWEPQPGHTDVDAGLRNGSLKFTLHGAKMKGNWTLVRMGGKAANEKKPNWLLIKEHDSFERAEKEKPITEEAPNSVVTKRSMQQIGDSEDHVWNSAKTGEDKTGKKTTSHRNDAKSGRKKDGRSSLAPSLSGAPREDLPDFIAPQLATLATKPSTDAGWMNELKLDGYRIQARLDHGKVALLTRNGLDWTHRMKAIAAEVAELPAKSALLDGEIVVLREDGNTSFADLQAAFQEGIKKPLTYFLFDLLHLNGHNLRTLPLSERKALLAGLLKDAGPDLRLSEHLNSNAATVFEKACELHAEGIVTKRADAPYTSGRSSTWLKLKCIHEQEFVIGGFTLPAKGHAGIHGVGSLLLGYYDASRNLKYAGRTGTGFTQKTHAVLRTQLEKLRQSGNPFSSPPGEARRGAIWVKPKLVAQVRFANWTAENIVRQASFQGLREDKPASEVHKDNPAPKPRGARQSTGSKHASHSVSSTRAAKAVPSKGGPPASHAPVRLTHPDKNLDADSMLTKQQLADYYWAIAPHMLTQIAGRPISLVRCPEGSTKPCFFQKHTGPTLPPGLETIQVPDKKTGKPEPYITLSTPEGLAGLAQMGVLELHSWGSRNDDLEHPDWIVFDLDPDVAITWRTLADAALEVKKRLKKLGLESFLKSTGGKGLHVVAPIEPEHDWATIKQFAHSFVLKLESSEPALYLTKMTKSARAGKIYLDYLRNERGATSVAAFSPRARAGAPVALPLSWNELKLKDRPLFHVADYAAWKKRLVRDPWKNFFAIRQKLPPQSPRE